MNPLETCPKELTEICASGAGGKGLGLKSQEGRSQE